MINVEDVVDVTKDEISKKEKSKKVLKLTKEFFKFPYCVNGVSPDNYIPVSRFTPLFGKTVIGIWPQSDDLACYNEKSFSEFMEFAKLYEIKIKKPKLKTDYS